MNKYLWMAVDADEYELPIFVGDTAKEVGDKFGIKKNSVIDAVSKQRNGRENGFKYVKVLNDGNSKDTLQAQRLFIQEVSGSHAIL